MQAETESIWAHYSSLGWPRWLLLAGPLSPRRPSRLHTTHRWPCRLPASARLTLAAPSEVLAAASQQAARHTSDETLQLSSPSLPCALAQHPATLIDTSGRIFTLRPEPVCARCSSSPRSPSHCYCYYNHPQLSRFVANHPSNVTAPTRPRAI